MKKQLIAAGLAGLMAMSITACSGGDNTTTPSGTTSGSNAPADGYGLQVKDTDGDGLITVGFAQVGAESGWRTANTQSYQDYFTEANGFKLVFLSANGDSDLQKTQVRDLIAQKVEVIDIAPVTDSGWEPVLQDAKDAGIPVIISDRQLSVDPNLYLTYFGGDMNAEGQRACDWLKAYMADNNMTDATIVHLQGTMGSTAQVGRSQALKDALTANSNWSVVYEQTGNFTRDDGQQAMAAFLQQNKDFNVIYSENDDMTYGAIDALTAAGKDPKDYVIISFDGNKSAVKMVQDGIIDVIAECDPLLGPQVGDLIKQSMDGQVPEKVTYSKEGIIDSTNADAKYQTAFGS